MIIIKMLLFESLNFLIIPPRVKGRNENRESGKDITDALRIIIMEMQIGCQRDAIYHNFLDSHGGWHLKILSLIIARRPLVNVKTKEHEGEPRFDSRDIKVKRMRQPLG